MKLINETPFSAAVIEGPTPDGGGLVLVVKGIFTLCASAQASVKTERGILSAGRLWVEPNGAVCRYPSDLVPWKPECDVLMRANITNSKTDIQTVQLSLGTLLKRVALTGALAGSPLASFQPVPENTASGLQSNGTYDAAWLKGRWPWFPVDFDWSYFNAAPLDQRIAGYLRGDERLKVTGLTDEAHETWLPGLQPRFFLRRGGRSPAIEEVSLVLDTVWIDLVDEELVLVWRGFTSKGREDDGDRALVTVEPLHPKLLPKSSFEDDARWNRRTASDAANHLPTDTAGAAAETTPGDVAMADAAAEKAAMTESLTEARAMLRANGMSAEFLLKAESATTFAAMHALLSTLIPQSVEPPPSFEALEEPARKFLREHGHDASILDPPEVEPEGALVASPTQLTRDLVAARVARHESLEGADLSNLDLSELNLAGGRFSGARLDGAKLTRANLEGADFTGASLNDVAAEGARFVRVVSPRASFEGLSATGASFLDANLAGARFPNATLSDVCFEGADLTGALLTNSNLERASLNSAICERTEFQLARLGQISAVRASFRGADFTGAELEKANLTTADLTCAIVARARFNGAILEGATLERASGAEASFEGANLTRVRAGQGCAFPQGNFRNIRGDHAIFANAKLTGAVFDGATLVRASFRGASLDGSSFRQTKLEHIDLSHASLAGARLTNANVFQGLLPHVNLEGADCRESNFFECEFWQAVTTGARFEGSNLQRTKLAGPLPQ